MEKQEPVQPYDTVWKSCICLPHKLLHDVTHLYSQPEKPAAARPVGEESAGGIFRPSLESDRAPVTAPGSHYLSRMPPTLLGLHHVTATVDEAQPDLDFFTGPLGMRLVKRTVNFDNTSVYHFYYGDAAGTPGTIFTTFPYANQGVRRGVHGAGQIGKTSLAVPPRSIGRWRARLGAMGIPFENREDTTGEALALSDPSGLVMELIETPGDDRTPWTGAGVEPEQAVRGLHSVTLHIRQPAVTRDFLTGVLGFEVTEEGADWTRLGVAGGGAGRTVQISEAGAEVPDGVNGLGTVHHVAFAVASAEDQMAFRRDLVGRGVRVTEVLDRQYFQSIYFREPGGVLYEIATVAPGFTADEDLGLLGTVLKLPPWVEGRRAEIEKELEPVRG